jgi:hypothetical protein
MTDDTNSDSDDSSDDERLAEYEDCDDVQVLYDFGGNWMAVKDGERIDSGRLER